MSGTRTGTVRTKTFMGNQLKAGSNDDGTPSDLTLSVDDGKQVIVQNDLNVLENLISSGFYNPLTSNAPLATSLIQAKTSTDLVTRPGASGSIVLNGDVEITGSISYVTPSINYNNNLIVNANSAVTLGSSSNASNVDISGGGLLLRGTNYVDDPQSLSVTWQNSSEGSPVP
jgi:hypothetical protein